MIYTEQVQGSAQAALPFIVNVDTIYLHTNVIPIEDEEDLYQYTERQYSFAEFADFADEVLATLDEDVRKDAIAQLKEKQII